ncbi:hypothetical protein GQ42DRAFT_144578 [Ramicandelaber brevisporus]|nr:hypothetical protein GQ42DRAFT_144578 [Ramicandelaber brevisporus]
MGREPEPSLNEQAFVLSALRKGIRVDGRKPGMSRSKKLVFGPESGQAELTLGHTRVLAICSGQITRPNPDRPTEGLFNISIELSPMASPAFEAGRQSDEEAMISRLLEKTLKRSRAIDAESLCIVAGEQVWSIRVDVHVLDHDGNLADACCVAAIAALRHFRRNDVTVTGAGEEVIVHPVDQRAPVPLSIHHTPVCVTFAFFEDNSEDAADVNGLAPFVVDPTLLEEQVQQGAMTVALNANHELCLLSKAGSAPVSQATVFKCVEDAAEIVNETIKLIDDELAKFYPKQ